MKRERKMKKGKYHWNLWFWVWCNMYDYRWQVHGWLDFGFYVFFHMLSNKKLFDTYKPYGGSDVIMANGLRIKVIRKYTIKIRMHDGAI